jgi:hypothetical protein
MERAMPRVIEPSDYDPRFYGPGEEVYSGRDSKGKLDRPKPGNYEDWVMTYVDPDKLNQKNVEQIILIQRRLMALWGKPRKHEVPNLDEPVLTRPPKPRLVIRRISDG